MSDVVLINSFEVAPGDEAAAIAYWERAAEHLRRQPGFIDTRLHRTVAPGARFLLVNVATWRSAEDFRAATADPAFRALVGPEMGRFPHHPGLYEVIRT
ncbi:antibiotic biosynthesis monooxygenase family protein [Methylobacterium platani]|uniref:Antibiotic biosynthesis monooxygenase n=2 Tax=Methylobacterium platani TaxID=427683 RepID=A0A179S2J2_9HYPH|nr:antibiotic biosynthesis monooxygenase family protein [Methylobacterium platani]KMO15452.1 antibiotic biosynthesis monooxygenase [Methylobacterium platani JCM 14648]OAS18571.1 antibiotic biosynthesis monooxygenase [Methylobacterium platani]